MAEERSERLSAIRGFPSQTSHRLSALSGVAFVVLIVLSTVLDGVRPTFSDSASKYASYYSDHHSKLQIAVLLAIFSTFALAWFLGFLRWLYEGAERNARGFVRAAPIAFAGGVVGLAVAAAAGMAEVTAVELTGSIPNPFIRALSLMNFYGTMWAAVLLSVFLLSSFFIIRVTSVLPEWLGFVAMAGTILGFFQAVVVLSPSGDDSVFGIAGLVWFLLFLVFVLGSSITLARRVETSIIG